MKREPGDRVASKDNGSRQTTVKNGGKDAARSGKDVARNGKEAVRADRDPARPDRDNAKNQGKDSTKNQQIRERDSSKRIKNKDDSKGSMHDNVKQEGKNNAKNGGKDAAAITTGATVTKAHAKDGVKQHNDKGMPKEKNRENKGTPKQPQAYSKNGEREYPYNRSHGGGKSRHFNQNIRIKAEETIDDIKIDITRIEKEIDLEIKEIQSLKLVL